MTEEDVIYYVHRFYPKISLVFHMKGTDRFGVAFFARYDRNIEYPSKRSTGDIICLGINSVLLSNPSISDSDIIDILNHELLHIEMYLNGKNFQDKDIEFKDRLKQLGQQEYAPDYLCNEIRNKVWSLPVKIE